MRESIAFNISTFHISPSQTVFLYLHSLLLPTDGAKANIKQQTQSALSDNFLTSLIGIEGRGKNKEERQEAIKSEGKRYV